MKIHFMGIGGSGVAGVASLAQKMGYEVSGCDLEASTAYSAHVFQGHDKEHIKDVDLVVVSPAVFYQNDNHPEVTEARKLGKLMTWQEFLGTILLKDKRLICIAGTHGKSTTTAMAGKMLIDNGFDPIVVVGAHIPEWGGNSRYGKGKYAVVEADEFNNNFLFYHPEIAIINNIEFDHPDFFKNEDEVRLSFSKFVKNLVGPKILITEKDNLGKKFNLQLFGKHNQDNANMVYILGKKLGLADEKIIKSIESFKGIGRRMELIHDGKIQVYDDYAHHPTAIKTTLEGVREKFPNKKILAVVEAHGYKRTKALLPKYNDVFDAVDKVYVGPIFPARDVRTYGMSPERIAQASNHLNVRSFGSFEYLIENCRLEIENFDIIVVMGAGKSYIWAREIADLFPTSFSDLTTFKTGGKIKKFFEVRSKEEILAAVKFAKDNNLPVFTIGGGTDILVSDSEFEGVVIKFVGDNLKLEGDILTAEAGMIWDDMVKFAVENNLQGIECLSGIPGTVGASPVQNVGAYGQELSETFVSLHAYDIEKGKFVEMSKKDCKFGYRDSIFKDKNHWQKFIICDITLKLKKNGKPTANYESLMKYLKPGTPNLKEVRDAVTKTRAEKLEDPKLIGNAGSFFKNPIISENEKVELQNKFPDIKIFPFADKFKISAGWLIETAGWKGKTYKTAGVSKKHALILINPDGKAKAEDVYELSEMIIKDIFEKFGIKLEREVQLINF